MFLKKLLLSQYILVKSFSKRKQWKGQQPIFCLSLQKTGTTSVGSFFEYFDYPVLRSDLANLRLWNLFWYKGKFHWIFKDPVFKNYQVFEDAPFWAKDFYKELYQKFPQAHFILFTRDKDAWFESLLSHGKGDVLGNKKFHAKNYEREDAWKNPNFELKKERAYYTAFYEKRNTEIIDFFKQHPANFIHLRLEDPQKWEKLAKVFDLELPENFEIHSNRKSDD